MPFTANLSLHQHIVESEDSIIRQDGNKAIVGYRQDAPSCRVLFGKMETYRRLECPL